LVFKEAVLVSVKQIHLYISLDIIMHRKQAFVLSSLFILSGCGPLPRYSHMTQPMYQASKPDLAVLGTPAVSDAKAGEVERRRLEKGIYWPNYRMISLENTPVDNIYAYYYNSDPHYLPFLVDETVSFTKNGDTPWASLDGSHFNAPENIQDAMTAKAIRAWIGSRDTVVMKFGSGRKRHFLYLAAPDCPSSKRFDDTLKKIAKDLDVTLYTKPISISGSSQAQAMIKNIVCAPSPMQEWFRLRSGRPLKNYTCSTQPLSDKDTGIWGSLLSINIETPTLIAEDGNKIDLRRFLQASSQEQAKSELKLILDETTRPGKSLFPEY
jgi:hypothetical protein